MRYDDASQAGPADHSDTVARPDVDTLAPGSYGPATGNAITGQGTSSGLSGADSVGAAPAAIVSVQGAGGQAVLANGAFQATGQYGALSIDAQGNFSYVRNPGTPDGVQDVFNYTLADASGDNASTTLTIDIGQIAAAAAGQGIVNLPAGVEMSDIHVNGRDLVIDMPDGSQMVIPGGAVFVPQIMIGDVQVPPTNLAALLIDSEPQPAAGTPQSSGGNFAEPVPPLDPGVPLGDLIPPTELSYTPPEFHEVNQFIDREPTVIIETPDFPAGAVDASESVNEKGLPVRNGAEPAGSGEIADGNGANDSDSSETNGGTIVFTAEDGLQSVTINGEAVNEVGQEIAGEFGTLTITGIDLDNGQITYSYTLGDNTSGDATSDVFAIVVTDDDGDTATGSLTVNIIDDVPTARNDTDSTDLVNHVATGNVMTGADTTSGAAGADTVGADNATLTAVSSNNNGNADSSFDSSGNLVVDGEFGSLTIKADGSYVYTAHQNAPGGSSEVFTYTLTDGDGDTSQATLTITNPDHVPVVGENGLVQLDDDALAGGNPGGTGDDPDSVNTTGTLSGSGGDGPLAFALTADGAPEGFTYALQSNGSLWVMQGSTHVLTITVNGATGAYTVTQVAPIDHPADANENNVAFDVSYTVTDSDGDTATGHLPINVDDDTPIARNDTDALAKGADSTDGNVLTGAGTTSGAAGADSAGADGLPNGVTGIHAGTSGSFADVTSGGTIVHGTFGDLVIHSDGTYTYSLTGNQGAGGNEVFTYEITDGDGDVSTATLTITVPADSIPVANNATALVDDDGLPGGNHDSAPGDDTQSPDPDNNESTFSGTVSANFGTDGPGTFTFSSDMDGKVVTIGQEQVTYHVAGNVLTAEVSDGARTGTDLFTVTLNSNGTYTVQLINDVHQVDDGTNTENNATADITFTAHDSDGDTDNGTLTITFDDDIPVANPPSPPEEPGGPTTPLIHGLVDEDDLSIRNGDNVDGNHDHVTGDDEPIDASGDSDPTTTGGLAGSLAALFSAGADTPLTFTLSDDTSGLPTLHSGGVLVTYSVDGDVLTASAGSETVFTLTVNPDGSWSFDLVGALDHAPGDAENNIDLDLGSIIIATDADGDSTAGAGGAFIVTVDDDLPTAITPPDNPQDPEGPPLPLVTGLVDEDDLSTANGDNVTGNHDHLAGDDEPVDASGDSDPTTTGGLAGSLAALFNAGADVPLTFELSADTSGLPTLHSGGVLVTYSVDGDVLTASAGDETVFTLTVNPDGSWTFDLQGALDHPQAGTEDNLLLDLGSIITAVDADGDPATAAPGAFVINVDDDMPQPFDGCPDDVITTNAAGSHFDGDLNLPAVGADQPGKVTFGVSDGDPVLDSAQHPVTAEGLPLFYFVNGDGVLEAREGGASGDVAFTITLNPDGTFDYDQLIDITSTTTVHIDNLTSIGGGNVDAKAIDVPNSPFDLILSTQSDNTVNTNQNFIGAATGQSLESGDAIRVDFVQDAFTTGSGGGAVLNFGEYYDATSYRQDVGGLNSVQFADFTVRAITVVESGSPTGTAADGDNVFYGDTNDTTVADTQLNIYDASGNLVNVAAYNASNPAGDPDLVVTDNGDGTWTIENLPQSFDFEITSSTPFNAVEVQALDSSDTFKLGVIDMTQVVQTSVEMSVPVVLTDADGDPVTCDIDLILGPPASSPDVRVQVDESGLNDVGSNPGSTSETVTGDLSDVASGGSGTTTFALQGDGHGSHGTLTLNADGTYSYTLTSPVDGPTADNGTNVAPGIETFTYEMIQNGETVGTGTITVDVRDDVPTAVNDTDLIALGADSASGNVMTGSVIGSVTDDSNSSDGSADTIGADRPGEVMQVSFTDPHNADPATNTTTVSVPSGGSTTIAGEFGTLTIYANGDYSYDRASGSPGDAVDKFTYTIVDADGDTSHADLTITIEDAGVTDVIPTDAASTTVYETALGTDPQGTSEAAAPGANDDPREVVTGTITFTAADGLGGVEIAGTTVDVSASATFPQTVSDDATGKLEITGVTFDEATGEGSVTYRYTLEDNTLGNQSTNGGNTTVSFAVDITDGDGDHSPAGNLVVTIVDDAPIAHADTNSVAEGGSVSGNVVTDGTDDLFGADGPVAANAGVTGVATGSDTSSPVSGNIGSDLDGQYGTLHLNANGTYTYVANPDSVTADAVDHFVYTITDGDGDTSTVTLDITVNNSTLGVSDDEALVNEAGLATGSNPGSTSEIDADGQIVVTGGTTPYTFALDGSATGTHGTLTLNPDGTYSYTLTSPVDGTTADNGANTVTNVDHFDYTATDHNGNQVHGTITVDVIDDVPTAHADTNSVAEGGSVNGNVITDGTDDVFGADGPVAANAGVTGVATGSDTSSPVSGNVGSDLDGQYGTLHLNANGTYTYTADPDSVTADSVDHFVYTITDGDGDTSTVTLDITVNNATLGASDDEALVNEAGLSSGSNPGSTSETDADGQIVVTGGTTPYTFTLDGSATGTHGTLTLNPDGTYSYTLTSPVDGTTADNGTNTVTNVDHFDYTATDDNGNTVHGTITVDVIDDVPTAHADTNSVAEGGSVNGNVITDGTDDVFGADGPAAANAGVTGVATGSDTSSPVSGNVGSDLDGQYGTLHLNANGTYTYTADPNSVTADAVDHFVYTITDGDGDTSTVTLDITVNNTTLVADNDTVTVYEAALDLVQDNRTGTLNDDLAAGSVNGTDPNSAGETVSGQLAVTGATTYAIVGSTTGNYGEIHINSDGSYTYTLTDPVDNTPHADDGHDTKAAGDQFTYVATDANGNSVQGTITVDIVDDAPLDFSPIAAVAENTGSDVVSGHLDVEDTDSSLVDNAGADGIGSLAWDVTDATPLLDGDGNPVKAGGLPVLLYVETDGTLTATTDHSLASATVFTATLDPATSSYEIDFDRVLDNGSTTASDFTSLAAGNTPWKGLDTSVKADGTHPTIGETETGAANDSTDLLFTGYTGTVSPGGTLITINTDSDDIGTGTGQKINPNEYLRVDMVQDLRQDGGGVDESDAGGYHYDDHVGQTHFQFGIIESQAHGEVDVLIKAFNVDDNASLVSTPQTNVDATGINHEVPLDIASIEVTMPDGTVVSSSTYTVYSDGSGGIYVQGVPEHALISFQAVGGASFEAVTIENANGDQIPGATTGTVFTGANFATGAFTFGVNDAGDPVDFQLPVVLTDGDGDTSTGAIDVTVYPEGHLPAATTTLMAQDSTVHTLSFETTSLTASNDNNAQHSQETQRTLSSGQNTVLMGALAAVGLEAEHGSLAANSAGDTNGGHSATVETFQASTISGSALDAGHGAAPAHVAEAMVVAESVQSNSGATRFHDMGDHARGVAHTDAKQGTEMTELLHGSTGPAHGQAADATPVTAAAVAMPSAEQLVAASGGNAAAQAQASVSGESAQHNQVVGKVLADALHGGEGHGPNIDAALHAIHGNGPAHDAIAEFASHGGGAVSFGHMAFGSSFFGPHGMLAVEMMHTDAAPPAHG